MPPFLWLYWQKWGYSTLRGRCKSVVAAYVPALDIVYYAMETSILHSQKPIFVWPRTTMIPLRQSSNMSGFSKEKVIWIHLWHPLMLKVRWERKERKCFSLLFSLLSLVFRTSKVSLMVTSTSVDSKKALKKYGFPYA